MGMHVHTCLCACDCICAQVCAPAIVFLYRVGTFVRANA